ncbi:hypothetical protein T484DRAFT_1805346 [Baffinella frigidus]|nr:hypothetical protein T484DRAFT_1805346 [Cryptophyta sp. CCMP2293]
MNRQLAKEVARGKNLDYSRPARPDAKRHSNALPALTVARPRRLLRSNSVPQLDAAMHEQDTATHFTRSQSSAVSTHGGYEHLPEDAASANHRTVEDCMRDWENAEQKITSAFFLVWAVGVTLLGVWHVASQFSASVAHLQVAVAVLAATCTVWVRV